MRSAEAAGAHGLVLPDRRSVGITPAVLRASAGAAEHLHVATVGNLSSAFQELQRAGLWIVGLDAGRDGALRPGRPAGAHCAGGPAAKAKG